MTVVGLHDTGPRALFADSVSYLTVSLESVCELYPITSTSTVTPGWRHQLRDILVSFGEYFGLSSETLRSFRGVHSTSHATILFEGGGGGGTAYKRTIYKAKGRKQQCTPLGDEEGLGGVGEGGGGGSCSMKPCEISRAMKIPWQRTRGKTGRKTLGPKSYHAAGQSYSNGHAAGCRLTITIAARTPHRQWKRPVANRSPTPCL